MEKDKTAADRKATAFVITRDFNAPPELIWKAWTYPNIFKKWWGPKDFTCPHCEMDLQVGGKYLYCMRSPEGKNYWSTGEFLTIKPREELVFTDSFADEGGNVVPASDYGMDELPNEMTISVTLDKVGDKTRMRVEQEGMPEGKIREQTNEGWSQSFDKLTAALKRREQWS